MNLNNQKLGYIEGWLSAVINIVLFVFKLWVGMLSGSVAMVADAWHTLSDTLTSGIVLLGFWISGKPADDNHPFGHGRAEVIGAVIISTLLAVVGVGFLIKSIRQLLSFHPVTYGNVAIIVFAVSVIVKEGIARFSIWAGKKIDSRSLIADGWHHRSDAIASLLIVIGAFVGRIYWWVDGVLGIIVSLLIMYAAFDIFKGTAGDLMGEESDKELEEQIMQVAKSISPEVSGIHHIHVHKYGVHKEVTFHICFPGDKPLKQIHEVADEIENALRDRMNIEATIHFDPDYPDD